jgi:integrase
MDKQLLKERYPFLIQHMEKNGFSKSHINQIKICGRLIMRVIDNPRIKCYEDLFVFINNCGHSTTPSAIMKRKNHLGIIKQYVETGIYPSISSKTGFMRYNSIDRLQGEYRWLIDFYKTAVQDSGLRNSTIYGRSHNAACFLLSLQERGKICLSDIDESSVMSFFYNGKSIIKSSSYMKKVSSVLKTCSVQFPDCRRILAFLPCLKKHQKNISYITGEEESQLRSVLDEKDTRLCLRDKAIMILAFYTGLRGCDIAALTYKEIDWDNDVIRVKQNKTGILMELPLRPIVGNAIFEYITEERPKSGSPYIFLTTSRPHQKLHSASLWSIAKKAMIIAGIRVNGGRKGLHLLRHHLASSLLGKGIEPLIISTTLGHTSIESTNAYLSTDMVHLKLCALSIEKYPVGKEVFI